MKKNNATLYSKSPSSEEGFGENLKVLIIQQKMIGDVLTSSILCEAIKQKKTSAEVHYLVNNHTLPVVDNNPFIDKLVLFSPEIENSKLKLYRFLKEIQRENYDVVIDVYGKISSNLITFFSKAKIRIAYHKKHTSFIYTKTIERSKKPSHGYSLAIENRMKLLESIAIPFQEIQPKLYVTKTEISSAKTYLQNAGITLEKPLVMISVLGSNASKTYPSDFMAKILDELVEEQKNVQILFNYIPKQREEALEIYKYCKPQTQQQIFFDVFGKSLREFLAITHHCQAMLGNEGGAINMAKALEIPTFTIFSPYLNKKNWYGEKENKMHKAVHLADFIEYTKEDFVATKKNPSVFYRKFIPAYIVQPMRSFMQNLAL